MQGDPLLVKMVSGGFDLALASQLLVAAVALLTYRSNNKANRDNQSRILQEPFFKQQLDLCFQASNSAAILATENDSAKWEEARRNFWRLYWGPLCIFEDPQFATAMINIGRLIPPPDMPMPDKIPLTDKEYQKELINLSEQARLLFERSWKVKLGKLPTKVLI